VLPALNGTSPPREHSRYSRRLALAGGIVILTVTGSTILALLLLRQHQLDERRESLSVLARVLADHVERSFGLSDHIARAAQNALARAGLPSGQAERQALLQPEPLVVTLMRERGDKVLGVSLRDRQSRLVAESRLIDKASSGHEEIVLRYRLPANAAVPGGEIDVSLSRRSLETYFSRVAGEDDCAIRLLDGGGHVLADQASIDNSFASSRLTVLQPLERGSWSILVQCSRANALLGWKIGTIGGIVAVVLLDLAILLLIWLGGRQLSAAQSRAAQAARQARTDLLTGLPNRLAFQERIRDELSKAQHFGTSVAIIMIDLDGFKDINDGLGHVAGDALLKLAAERMRNRLRRGELLARLGGDEFAVIQSDAEQRYEILSLARHLREAFDEAFALDGASVRLSASMGAAIALRDGSALPDLLEKADLALYASKAERLGRLVFYQPHMGEAAARRTQLQTELANAMDRGEISLYYQPILDLEDGRVCGFEALMRWHHPERGLVPPDQFIPILEANGWILRVGEMALRSACHEAARWPDHMMVAVNLSPIQCHDPTLPNLVAEVLAASGLPAHRLELEITETASLDHERGAYEILHLLRKIGVRIALDDFGTGFASLSRLNSFPFDKLKIDKTFVSQLATSSQGRAVVRSTIDLGRRLGMTVTAEGVETFEQFTLLQRHHCTQIQGYILTVPLKPEALGPWLSGEPWREILATEAA
jgi:diguanylate cyclase (GGDEF)-like protein